MLNAKTFTVYLQAALSRKYKVQGIPTLVLINAEDGNLITKDGRSTVSQDPNGEKFPWLPETFEQIMSSCSFIGKDGDKITWDKCKDKTIGIYFSAHWVRELLNISIISISSCTIVSAVHKFYTTTCQVL